MPPCLNPATNLVPLLEKIFKGGSGVRARVLGCVLGHLLVLEVGPALVLRNLRVAARCLVLDDPGRSETLGAPPPEIG